MPHLRKAHRTSGKEPGAPGTALREEPVRGSLGEAVREAGARSPRDPLRGGPGAGPAPPVCGSKYSWDAWRRSRVLFSVSCHQAALPWPHRRGPQGSHRTGEACGGGPRTEQAAAALDTGHPLVLGSHRRGLRLRRPLAGQGGAHRLRGGPGTPQQAEHRWACPSFRRSLASSAGLRRQVHRGLGGRPRPAHGLGERVSSVTRRHAEPRAWKPWCTGSPSCCGSVGGSVVPQTERS